MARSSGHSGIAYIREYYGVPAKRGMVVEVHGRPARIVSARGPYLSVRRDGARCAHPYHPLDVDYLDGTDYAARHNARIQQFCDVVNGKSA